MKTEVIGGRPRILIVRLSAIGDCVLTVPLVHALRNMYPGAHLSWIVDERAAALLDGLAGLDELLVIPRRWHRSISSILGIRRALRRRDFDIVIDPQSLTKSGLLSRLTGASQRICFAPPVGRELGPWLGNVRVRPTREHVVEQTLQLIEPLGDHNPTNVIFNLPQYQGTDAIADFAAVCTRRASNIAVVNVGAGWPSKLWSAARFASVVRYLGVEHGLASIVVWHGREREMAVDVISQSGGHGHLAPVTSLRELATLCREAQLFIGSDTGPLHIAAAVGTPCVGLYGPTSPARCGPYGSQHRVIQPGGGVRLVRMRGGSENSLMQKIRVDQVTAACEQVLQHTDQGPRVTYEVVSTNESGSRCTATASRIGQRRLAGGGIR